MPAASAPTLRGATKYPAWTVIPSAAALPMPTMLVYGDADSIGITHIAEFYQLLGGGQRDAAQLGSCSGVIGDNFVTFNPTAHTGHGRSSACFIATSTRPSDSGPITPSGG